MAQSSRGPSGTSLYYAPNTFQAYQSTRVGEFLGAVVVFAVPAVELEQPHVVDVIRKSEENQLWPDAHAAHESEVCFFGYIPRAWKVHRQDLHILNWDDASIEKLATGTHALASAYAEYGFTPQNVRAQKAKDELKKLREYLSECVEESAKTALSAHYSSAETPLREYLGTLAYAALHARLTQMYQVMPGSQFELEKVIKGTAE